MAAKLKSISEKIPLPLLAKSTLVALAWAYLPFWLYVVVAVFIFFRTGSNPSRLGISFFLLLLLSYFSGWWTLNFFGYNFQSSLLILFLGVATFLILGLKEFLFTNRIQAYIALSSIIFSLAAAYFYWRLYPGNFFVTGLFLLFILLASFYEFYSFLEVSGYFRRLFTVVSSLVILELSWAIGLLPIGFLSQTALLLLFFAFLEYFFYDFHAGLMTRKSLVTNAVILAVCIILIAAFSNWRI